MVIAHAIQTVVFVSLRLSSGYQIHSVTRHQGSSLQPDGFGTSSSASPTSSSLKQGVRTGGPHELQLGAGSCNATVPPKSM